MLFFIRFNVALLYFPVQAYDGMIVGEHSRDTDLDVSSWFRLTFGVTLICGR